MRPKTPADDVSFGEFNNRKLNILSRRPDLKLSSFKAWKVSSDFVQCDKVMMDYDIKKRLEKTYSRVGCTEVKT